MNLSYRVLSHQPRLLPSQCRESQANAVGAIVNKSTVPIGSGDWVRRLVLDGAAECHSETTSFDVVSNPEFLREGSAIYDTFNPDRIVIGSSSQRAIGWVQMSR